MIEESKIVQKRLDKRRKVCYNNVSAPRVRLIERVLVILIGILIG